MGRSTKEMAQEYHVRIMHNTQHFVRGSRTKCDVK